jgi:limonene-1,2-epoxide hydrolase
MGASMSTNIQQRNTQFIKDFLGAIERNQKEEILSFFDEESVFNNIPMPTVKGLEGIWSILDQLHEVAESIQYELKNIAVTEEGNVLTERVDYYNVKGPAGDVAAKFLVMGAFEVEEKAGGDLVIRQWRDYFDINLCLAELPQDLHHPEVTGIE